MSSLSPEAGATPEVHRTSPTPEADPALTYAVLVGVDTYASPNLGNLTGPALDACRHAAWLRNREVPAANIRLLISPDHRSRPETERFAQEHGLEPQPATEANVWRVLDEELPLLRGDLLWFVWGGHAILDPDKQQRLFYADARRDRPVNLVMDDLERALLHDPRYSGIARKVCVVDACRNFVEFPGVLPLRTLAGRSSGQGRLLGLYAAQDGSTAGNSGPRKTGVFSSFLLPELENSRALPPDPDPILRRVKDAMAKADILQVPFLRERGWDGRQQLFGSQSRLSRHIRTHGEELERLSGKGRYLTEEFLPFVSPGAGHETDPASLMPRLTAALSEAQEEDRASDSPAKCGLLLLGTAGSGKTRTCFEVAALARREEWRVLHVSADATVTTDELTDAVYEQGGSPVLLVFDYLDSYTQLDLSALARAKEECCASGFPFACLASVRPGALRQIARRGGDLLFEQVVLRQDEQHHEAVAYRIFEKVAPQAFRRWGHEVIREVCGNRPIIALLIAREIESRLNEGLAMPEFTGLRNGDLLDWLRRRTEEDFLGNSPAAHPGPRGPETWLLTSTVAAAACAQERDAVERAVDHLLEIRPDQAFPSDGASVVARLVRLGWLLTTGEDTDVVHDIVTDELLQRSLIPDNLELQGRTATTLFNAMLSDARTFGRFVNHFRRWTADLDDQHRTEADRVCQNWLNGVAPTVVELLTAAPVEGGRILLALLSSSPWQTGAAQAWDQLVAPWLRYAEAHAPRLVTTFYANVPDAPPERLLTEALSWLTEHAGDSNAQNVITTLLRMSALTPEQAVVAMDHALTWITAHGTRDKRVFVVLRPLLEYADLSGERTVLSARFALAWLDAHPFSDISQFILRPLLRCRGLEDEQVRQAVESALAWLECHPVRPNNDFLLRALLQRRDLSEEQNELAGTHALAWLTVYGTRSTSDFVLRSLLGSTLTSGQAFRAIKFAFAWLDLHGRTEVAGFVLSALLGNSHLSGKQHTRGVDYALTWLGIHGKLLAGGFVLRPLLKSMASDAAPSRPVEHALDWLRSHLATTDAGYVLGPLLECSNLTDLQRAQASELALAWLSGHWQLPAGMYVIKPLLRDSRGREPQTRAAGYALAWLTHHAERVEASGVLSALLESPVLDDKQHDRIVEIALAWLGTHWESSAAQYVLRPLLRSSSSTWSCPLPDDQVPTAVTHALGWLNKYATGKNARYLLGFLLYRADLPSDRQPEVIDLALAWLDVHRDSANANGVVLPLLKRSALDDISRPRAVEHTLYWLRSHEQSEIAYRVLDSLLSLPGLAPEPRARATDLALAWLATQDGSPAAQWFLRSALKQSYLEEAAEARLVTLVLAQFERCGTTEEAQFVLNTLLTRPDLNAEKRTRITDHARTWLGTHGTTQGARSVLASFLERSDLDEESGAAAVDHALAWLDEYGTTEDARFVLRHLLPRPGLDHGSRTRTVRHALAWLDDYGAAEDARYVLASFFKRPDLDAAALTRATAHALAWLDRYGTMEVAQFVLNTLLPRPDLRAENRTLAIKQALAWLNAFSTTESARFVLGPFLERSDLEPEPTSALVGHAYTWLDTSGPTPRASYILQSLLEHRGLDPATRNDVITRSLDWLTEHGSLPRAGFVLAALLALPALPTPQAAATVAHALTWLDSTDPANEQHAAVTSELRKRGLLPHDQGYCRS
ncbi:MAG: hypothetical protein HOV70_31755 [Streptomyces sp.]|nr:hypothetical protein [Streptomyces sp.]